MVRNIYGQVTERYAEQAAGYGNDRNHSKSSERRNCQGERRRYNQPAGTTSEPGVNHRGMESVAQVMCPVDYDAGEHSGDVTDRRSDHECHSLAPGKPRSASLETAHQGNPQQNARGD